MDEVQSVQEPVVEEGSTLTQQQIAEAATQNPTLSPDEFKLGEATYKVVHLPYDDYIAFLAYLQPFLDALVARMGNKVKVSIPGLDIGKSLDASALVKFCMKSLPEMTQIIVKQTSPNMTIDEIKQIAGTPFVLAEIVLKQVIKNGMIKEFASFFVSMAPLLSSLK